MKVLAIDEGFIGSLHCALGLHAAGIDIVLLAAVGGDAIYERGAFVARLGPRPCDSDFLEHLDAVSRAHGCTLVYPMTEPTMLRLAAARTRVDIFPCLTTEQQLLISDKFDMSCMAAARGIAIPRQARIRHDETAECAHMALPVVIKPTAGRGGAGITICQSALAAQRAIARHSMSGRDCIAQQFIDGPTYLAGGLFLRGEPVRFYATEKLEQIPALTGPASHVRSVDNTELTTAALKLFRALQWTGLASADFIRARDGSFHFLEVNPRPWGSIAAARDAGVDLFTPLAGLMRGVTPEADLRFDTGIETRVLPLYLLDARRSGVRALRNVMTDVRSEQGRPFRDTRLALHIARRLLRVRSNWPS